MQRSLLVAVLLVCFVSSAQPRDYVEDAGWVDYRNNRFGFTLKYPAHMFESERTAKEGDGQLFISRDGKARLLVGAFENSDRHSPSSYQKFIAQESYSGFKIDYAPTGRSWSVLSGARDGTMFYEKAIFSCGGRVINSFAIMYPAAERHVYDAIVEVIEDTFRAGSQGCI